MPELEAEQVVEKPTVPIKKETNDAANSSTKSSVNSPKKVAQPANKQEVKVEQPVAVPVTIETATKPVKQIVKPPVATKSVDGSAPKKFDVQTLVTIVTSPP
jgi:hypothetical protein